ncbi:type II toxin-antitoxin system Phd/YefM family antitoxin [Phenylobacterium sp.]|uniref:type II toxin-antitoxin system Phd/YefM family antitoxin n=1 Tax=Phenylobacterium sp. TaxID=1871053 RepID=UPI0027321BC9|nr:type II toxin-antitoxin system prevent-host-death family antitoxin [Phenylobacterium sp.]MDP1616384.1 type II toxin-antitoxin system prevent-host-death family antitoxin [Phenylobacterium sp.]MDP1987563.1 type II toxin-antitoxin system prevent-host-death family antitoxin [Phenylobacterium sp.]
MSTYSVADAKNGLPRLIDLALEGEEIVITRHGKPVAELRAIRQVPMAPGADLDWLRARRLTPAGPALSSVELLREMYEDGEV